ncbi:MAG: hypothetical protein ACOZQL_07570 [Myxococcota bacterium]
MKSRVLVLGVVSLVGCAHVEVVDDHRINKQGVVELGCGEHAVLRLAGGGRYGWGPNLKVTKGRDGEVLKRLDPSGDELVSVEADVGPGGAIDNVWIRSRCRSPEATLRKEEGDVLRLGFTHRLPGKKGEGSSGAVTCVVMPSATLLQSDNGTWVPPAQRVSIQQGGAALFCHASPCSAELGHLTRVVCE